MTDQADKPSRRLATAIVIAGALIALAIYSRPAPRYSAFAEDGRVYRIDSKTGSLVACQGTRCEYILKFGQRIEGGSRRMRWWRQETTPDPSEQ